MYSPIYIDSFAELIRGYSPGQIENQNKGPLLEVQLGRKKKLINNSDIPQHVIEAIARCILPDIRTFYESEEGQREFAEWKASQQKKRAKDLER